MSKKRTIFCINESWELFVSRKLTNIARLVERGEQLEFLPMEAPVSYTMKKLICFALSGVLVLGLAGCSKGSRKARHLQRGERDYVAGQYEKAEIEYLNALRLDPKSVMAVQRLG